MGRVSENRIIFNKPNLRAIERRIDQGEFTRESYFYDTDSHLAIRVRPSQSYKDSALVMYWRWILP